MKRIRISYSWIIGVIALMSIVYVSMIESRKGMMLYGDTAFHINRILEIRQAFRAHDIPNWLNFVSFSQLGQAVNSMYPDITLWPLVLVTNGLSFFNQLLAIRIIILFLTVLITYFSLFNRGFSSEESFLASIVYGLSGYSLYQFTIEFQPGVAIIYAFTFPLIFLTIDVLKSEKFDIWLSIKLSLVFGIIIYSHLLSAVVVAIVIATLWIIKCSLSKSVNLYTIVNIFVASIFSFVYFLPILYRMYVVSKSHIAPPYGKGQVNAENFAALFQNPQVYSRTSLSLIAILLICLVIFKGKRSIFVYGLLGAELLLMILCTNIVPWTILERLPVINMLQFTPWRFGIWLSALPLLVFLCAWPTQSKVKVLFIISLLVSFSIPEIFHNNTTVGDFETAQHITQKNSTAIASNTLTRDYSPYNAVGNSIENEVSPAIKKIVKSSYLKDEKGRTYRAKKDVLGHDGIAIKTRKKLSKGDYIIPVYDYSSLKYNVSINNQEHVNIRQNNRGLMVVRITKNIPKNSTILIKYKNPRVYILLLLFSLIIYTIMAITTILNMRRKDLKLVVQ